MRAFEVGMITRIFRRNAATVPSSPSKQHLPEVVDDSNTEQIHNTCGLILHENVLIFLEWREIGRIIRLSRYMQELCEDSTVSPGVWMRMCFALGFETALYVPQSLRPVFHSSPDTKGVDKSSGAVWKHFFFENLWPARGKWGSGGGSLSSGASSDFKISVSVRFRPLKLNESDEKLGLPLHQYIRLRRQQAKNAGHVSIFT